VNDLPALIGQARTDAVEVARVHMEGTWLEGSPEILARYIRDSDVRGHLLAGNLARVASAALQRLPRDEAHSLLEGLARDPLDLGPPAPPELPEPKSAVPSPPGPPSPTAMPRQRKRTRGALRA
jgi:hypothetical protein